MNFKKALEKITGKKIKRNTPSASMNKNTNIEEARGLARLTRLMLRKPVEIEKSGKKLNIITTSDLDKNGKLYPDYKERRKKRKAKHEKGRLLRWVSNYNWKDDDD